MRNNIFKITGLTINAAHGGIAEDSGLVLFNANDNVPTIPSSKKIIKRFKKIDQYLLKGFTRVQD